MKALGESEGAERRETLREPGAKVKYEVCLMQITPFGKECLGSLVWGWKEIDAGVL